MFTNQQEKHKYPSKTIVHDGVTYVVKDLYDYSYVSALFWNENDNSFGISYTGTDPKIIEVAMNAAIDYLNKKGIKIYEQSRQET